MEEIRKDGMRFTLNGNEYTFSIRQITVGQLVQIKHWYGRELGSLNGFIAAFQVFDPEALLCAVWIARVSAGEKNVPEPQRMEDFNIADFFESVAEFAAQDEAAANGEVEAGSDPTPGADSSESGSSETSSPSEPNTSST